MRNGVRGGLDMARYPPAHQAGDVTETVKKKESFRRTRKFICFFLPKWCHKYVTPESIIMLKVGEVFALLQILVVSRWKEITEFTVEVALPHVLKIVTAIKSGLSDVVSLVLHSH